MRLIDADVLKEKLFIADDNLNPVVTETEIDETPTVEAKPVVRGKWHVQDNTFTKFKCSNCKAKNFTMKSNFCPNCGADMRGEKND